MATVCPPSQGCKQLDVGGTRYRQGRDGLFHGVADHHVKAMVQGAECFTPMVRPNQRRGWVCDDCGFIAAINHCGKCGSEHLTREA